MSETHIHPFVRAVELAGVGDIAKKLEITPSAVSKYHVRAKADPTLKIPAEWCLGVEDATGGRVTRYELREDIYPQERAA